ncbi:MAG: DUF4846 domain-containing protein, partial [Myxococcota bacterium]
MIYLLFSTIILFTSCSNKLPVDKKTSEGNFFKSLAKTEKPDNKSKLSNSEQKNHSLISLKKDNEISESGSSKNIKTKLTIPNQNQADSIYPWRNKKSKYISLARAVPAPAGYHRKIVKNGSYAWYLRHLPLKPTGTPVKTYKGTIIKSWQSFATAVIDLPLDSRGFMQCIDVIVKLRAEYLWWRRQKNKIGFLCGSNKSFTWKQWSQGIRYLKKNKQWKFLKTASSNSNRK